MEVVTVFHQHVVAHVVRLAEVFSEVTRRRQVANRRPLSVFVLASVLLNRPLDLLPKCLNLSFADSWELKLGLVCVIMGTTLVVQGVRAVAGGFASPRMFHSFADMCSCRLAAGVWTAISNCSPSRTPN